MPQAKEKFTVILEPENDRGYSVHCPALPGCVSQGEDREDALKNIREAISLTLEVLAADNGQQSPGADGKERLLSETPDVVADEIRQVLKARHEDGLRLTVETVVVEVTSPVSA